MLTQIQVENHVATLHDQGYAVVEGAIAPALVADLRAALDALEHAQGLGYAASRFEGYRTLRIYNLLAHDERFWQVPVHAHVLPIAERFLDPELLLSSLSAITLGPGQEAQPLHEDTQQIPLPRPRPAIALNAMWALSDFTAANGATRIIPGSHRYDGPPPFGAELPTVPAEMPAGSVMLFDSQLWHAGGTNTTAERRYAISCYYCVGWMRQQENQLLGIPMALAARMPRRLQELLGYGVWRGQYGHIANRDPIELLGRERGGRMIWDDRRVAEIMPAADDTPPT
jgi:ectoine hydroxylase-related dioxygenase (phytanoyl-CoA dioxygenase family)